MFVRLVVMLRKIAPRIQWHSMLESVASMSGADRSVITRELEVVCAHQLYWFDAAIIGQVSRLRLYWLTWEMHAGELECKDS
jgi:hypothetical protein